MPNKHTIEADGKGRIRIHEIVDVPGALREYQRLIAANMRIQIHTWMTQGQLEAAYAEKSKLSFEAGVHYKKNLAPHVGEWEHMPRSIMAKIIGLEAGEVNQPNSRMLEAGDYTDPNNQFQTLSGTLVIQRALPLFAYEYPELMAMFTDFSDEPGLYEQTEMTRIVSIPAVQKYNSALDANNFPVGFQTASPAKTQDAPVTLTDYVSIPIVIGAGTLNSTNRNLMDEQVPAAIKAIGGYFTGMVMPLLTPANFNAYTAVTAPDANNVVTVPVAYATYVKALIDFSMGDLDKLSGIFTQNKVPRRNRFILLNTSYYAKLRSDPRLEFFFAAAKGDPQLTEQTLPDGISGFYPYEAPYLPLNLPFFPAHKAGIILKQRLPGSFVNAVKTIVPGSITTVTDPDNKLSVSLVQYIDLVKGFALWRPETILGASVGDNRGGLCGAGA